MSIPILLIIVGLVLALIDEFRAQGQSLTAWAVVAVCLSLLWGQLG
jgi:drug/metabolite transporter superfamily protein YnfA